MILLFLFNISSISRIVFIVLTSKFVVKIQNLIYLQDLYNLEPYGSNIAIYRYILTLARPGVVVRIYRFLFNTCQSMFYLQITGYFEPSYISRHFNNSHHVLNPVY
jgi:hypothetical protein